MTTHPKAPLGERQLCSGNWSSTCPDCHTVMVAATLEELDGARCACRPIARQLVYLVELICLACGRRMGDVVATSTTAPVVVCGDPRCKHCGGQPHPSGFVRTLDLTRYPKLARPRRGRPSTKEQAA